MSALSRQSDPSPPLEPGSDLALVRAALKGDAEQREALGERLLLIPRIVRALNGRFGSKLSEQDLDDLSQDVFVIVWSKLEQFRGPGDLDPWVYRICQYRFQNHRRGLWRKSKLLVRNSEEVLTELTSQTDEKTEDPRAEGLEGSLANLGSETQEFIHLHHFDGLTFKEIAKHKQVHVSKVKSQYYRGLERIGRSLTLLQNSPSQGRAGL